MNHGVYVSEQATSVSTPVVAESGIPFVVGTAPVQSAQNPAQKGIPVLCTSWDEAVERLGYSDNWEKYTLCEFMYSHFKLYGRQPVIFCNVLDTSKSTKVAAADKNVVDHKILLPLEAIRSTVVVKLAAGTALTLDKDYGLYAQGENLVIELMSSGTAYAQTSLNVSYSTVSGNPTAADVATGFEAVELCMSLLGTVPDIFVAPGWSTETAVAAVMAAKAASINGMFRGIALVDLDSSASGATSCESAIAQKTAKNLTDKHMYVCWPKVTLGERTFHLSTQIAGLIAKVDGDNGGIPYESPSNKRLQCDGLVLGTGAPIMVTHQWATRLNAAGIVTAFNFVRGWVAFGNYTGCFPGNSDPKDCQLPISRMFAWVGNTLIKTFWSKVDAPMNRRLIDTTLDAANIWLNGLVGQQYLLGGRVEMIAAENTLDHLMAGIVKLHVYLTPPAPAQEFDFVLEYDASYVSSAFGE